MEPFDPALASGPTRRLPIGDVVDLLSQTHAPDRIAAYRDAMRRGARFPPIAVIALAGRFVVADGHKRLNAYAALGRPEILVEVWTPGRLLRDQLRQASENARKNRRILGQVWSDPKSAGRLFLTTLHHWKRVAVSLCTRATGPV